jgi:integrase
MAKSGKWAVVCHNRKIHRLGYWGSPEAKIGYARFIAELQSTPATFGIGQRAGTGGTDVLVAELAADYFRHIQNRMHPAHINHFKTTIGYLAKIYGDILVDSFSPKKLKTVRDQMIRRGSLCRKVINDYTRRIVQIFAWGCEEELVQQSTVAALREVRSLPKGTPGTFDHPPKQDVPVDVIRRTSPFMSPTVQAMSMVQWFTGMRSCEVCKMRVGDIDKTRDSELWHYIPDGHKTEEYIGEKIVPLGKPEQELIAPYLIDKKPGSAVFSPRTAVQEMKEQRRAERKSKITPSQQERDKQRAMNPADNVGEFYDESSYRKAVEHAIKKANKTLPDGRKIPRWTPYQIRHAATKESHGICYGH